jgi:hypothetical protein
MDPKKTSDQIHGQVATYLSDFAGQSEPHKDVLSGPRRDSEVLHAAMDKINSGECTVHDLARAYKHSPHSPPAVLMKYVAHRVNNLDGYNSSHKGHLLDHAFMASIGSGGASVHNNEVSPRHLNHWLLTNPGLIESVLHNKQNLSNLAYKSGLNIRKINGEPHVALTRGLNTPVMKPEMPLASFSDMNHSGFGMYQHHVWMPLKDLWYSFPASPNAAQGSFGHENEWVLSNSGQRYIAKNDDIKTSHFSAVNGHLDPELVALGGLEDDTAATLISSGRLAPSHAERLHELGLLGPKTLGVVSTQGVPPIFANHSAVHPDIALAQAMKLSDDWAEENSTHALIALNNPNLTAKDLSTVATSPTFPVANKNLRTRALTAIASHPSFNEAVGADLVADSRSDPQNMLPIIARNAQVPCLALHRALIEGLDAGETCPYSPAKTVASCFTTSSTNGFPVGATPQAFNNTRNSERYLRALADYFGKYGDELESPSDVYTTMLSGARLDDTTLNVLVDLSKNNQPLSGLTPQQHAEVFAEMARWNPTLTPRQLLKLSELPECAEELLNRDGLLLSPVQVNIAKTANDAASAKLALREDLSVEAADVLLKKLSTGGNGVIFKVASIARNPRIPIFTIEKHVNHESSAEFANAVAHGLSERAKEAGIDLPEPPVGGIE